MIFIQKRQISCIVADHTDVHILFSKFWGFESKLGLILALAGSNFDIFAFELVKISFVVMFDIHPQQMNDILLQQLIFKPVRCFPCKRDKHHP
jgi:hypothetical protein